MRVGIPGEATILTLLLVLIQGAGDPVDRLVADHRALTSVAIRCSGPDRPDEVVVCGRRRADGFRLPFKTAPAIDNHRDWQTVQARERLLVPPNNCAEKSAFLVGCGKAGVGVGVGGDGRTRLLTRRELSP